MRRSTRLVSQVNFSKYHGGIYHIQGKPDTDLEHLVHQLNKESFPTNRYGKVDDIVAYSIFASKKRSNHRTLHVLSSLTHEPIELEADVGISIAASIFRDTSEDEPTWGECLMASENLISSHPVQFCQKDRKLLSQFVYNFLRFNGILTFFSKCNSSLSSSLFKAQFGKAQ
jgi:hypothetical protein